MTPRPDVALAPLTTMGVGGAARWFVDARRDEDVMSALTWAAELGLPVHVLGGGSNVVIADRGFDGLVVRIAVTGIEVAPVDGKMVFTVGAGEPWDPFVARTVDAQCAGVECLSGIPGYVGGTPVQNVGAYGQDVSGTIVRVDTVDRHDLRRVTFTNAECEFGYRTSRFKRADLHRYVVTRVAFALLPGGPATVSYADLVAAFEQSGEPRTLAAVRDTTLAIRRRKGMVMETAPHTLRSCGSFFVNPVIALERFHDIAVRAAPERVPHYPAGERVKVPAAWLIEHAGFVRGFARGAVGISPYQAQAIVNHGGASADDVLQLACDIKRAVWETFGIMLLPEPVFVGFDASPALRWLHQVAPEGELARGLE